MKRSIRTPTIRTQKIESLSSGKQTEKAGHFGSQSLVEVVHGATEAVLDDDQVTDGGDQ
jgi:hypothetical protein